MPTKVRANQCDQAITAANRVIADAEASDAQDDENIEWHKWHKGETEKLRAAAIISKKEAEQRKEEICIEAVA